MTKHDFTAYGAFHLISRFASIQATRAGLDVRVENDVWGCPQIVWLGTEQQFRAYGVLTPSMQAPARKVLRYFDQLVGELQRCGPNSFRFGVIDCFDCWSVRVTAKFAKAAMKDTSYMRFRDGLLASLKGLYEPN